MNEKQKNTQSQSERREEQKKRIENKDKIEEKKVGCWKTGSNERPRKEDRRKRRMKGRGR